MGTVDGCKAVAAALQFRDSVLCDPYVLPVAAWWRNRLLLLGPCSKDCVSELSVGSTAAANVGSHAEDHGLMGLSLLNFVTANKGTPSSWQYFHVDWLCWRRSGTLHSFPTEKICL